MVARRQFTVISSSISLFKCPTAYGFTILGGRSNRGSLHFAAKTEDGPLWPEYIALDWRLAGHSFW